MDDLVTCVLVYLSIGALIWLVLDGLGIIENSFAEKPTCARPLVFATLMMIVAWPAFVYEWIKGLRRQAR